MCAPDASHAEHVGPPASPSLSGSAPRRSRRSSRSPSSVSTCFSHSGPAHFQLSGVAIQSSDKIAPPTSFGCRCVPAASRRSAFQTTRTPSPSSRAPRLFEVGELHDHHVAVVTAVLVEQTAGGRAVLLAGDTTSRNASPSREQRVHETELGDARIAVADVDTERLAQRVDGGSRGRGRRGRLGEGGWSWRQTYAPAAATRSVEIGPGAARPACPALAIAERPARRHDGPSGPVSTGVGMSPRRRRRPPIRRALVGQLHTAVSIRERRATARRRSGCGRIGLPNVTSVRPGRGRFMPLPMIRPVPSRWIGTTGASVRTER